SRPRWTGWPHSRTNLAALLSTPHHFPGRPPALAGPAAVSALVALHGDRCFGCARSAACWCADCGAVLPAVRLCLPPVSCLPSGLPAVGAQRAIATLPPCSCQNRRAPPYLCRTALRSGVFAACSLSFGHRARPCTSGRRRGRP